MPLQLSMRLDEKYTFKSFSRPPANLFTTTMDFR